MLIGYARVSSQDQNLISQIDALKEAGCDAENIYTDKASGLKTARPGLDAALSHLRTGDTLLVFRLDRLGRSTDHLVKLVKELGLKGVHFKSLTEHIDTSSSMGEFIFRLFASLAELELSFIIERTAAGRASARARGRLGGRKQTHSDRKILSAKQMADTTNKTITEICEELGISTMTYYRRLKDIKTK